MEAVKIYGLCLERLRHQIRLAKERAGNGSEEALLESYRTGDIDEIIDILEIYDIGQRTQEALLEKLEDLAYTVSVLTMERISFGLTPEGHFGIYLALKNPAFSISEMACSYAS